MEHSTYWVRNDENSIDRLIFLSILFDLSSKDFMLLIGERFSNGCLFLLDNNLSPLCFPCNPKKKKNPLLSEVSSMTSFFAC